jgi:PmbA protein
VAKDGKSMQRDYDYSTARDANQLASIDETARRAAERTVSRLQARRIKACKAPVIFQAEIAKGLIGSFVSAISGGNLYRESSFLLNSLGKKIFPDKITLTEDPHILKGLGSAPFDEEGVITKKRDIIDEGVLQGYVLNSYSARKLGMQTTGNSGGVHNLIINHSNKDLKDLLQTMGNGLLVTEVIGHGVNLVTGDYSRGAAGFWIEQGKIAFPVEEITIAGNLKNMYQAILEVGNDVDIRGNIHTGSILVAEMMIAGD